MKARLAQKGMAYLRVSRLSNLPTVWTNVCAAAAVAGGLQSGLPWFWMLLSFSCFYIGGMFLNDAFDYHIDRKERPERALPQGLLSQVEAFAVGTLLLLMANGSLLLAGMLCFSSNLVDIGLWGFGLTTCIVYYNYHHKENVWSPFIMAGCRFLTYLATVSVVLGAPSNGVWMAAAMLASYVIGLSYIARQETQTRLIGRWPLLFLAMPFLYVVPFAFESLVTLALVVIFGVWVGMCVLQIVYYRDKIFQSVGLLIAGIACWDAILLSIYAEPWAALLGLAGAVLTRLAHRWIPGN